MSSTISDRIYGKIEITDPLILELMQSAPIQRLRKISQDGARHFIEPIWDVTRFEHSVGTWYLAKHFQRSMEEQVACLLHDVPHTAFSHVVDFVVSDHNQEYHDQFLSKVVLNSDVPDICKKHGLDIHKVLRKEDYRLLDNRTPELSFDRWDYFMRDAQVMGLLSPAMVRSIIDSAKLKDEQFYFDDLAVASQLCTTSLMVCQLAYSATSHGSWSLLAEAIKIALKERIITQQDLFTTDDLVWNKLQAAKNTRINAYLHRLQPGKGFEYAPKSEAEFHGKDKARYIDALVLKDGKLQKTSELVVGLADYIEAFKQRCLRFDVRQEDITLRD